MKTYYIIKFYACTFVNGEYIERYHYFGKSNKLIGYKTESDSKKYTEADVKNYGFRIYKNALKSAWALKALERSQGWQVSLSIILETILT